MSNLTIFPTPLEQIRGLVNLFDLRPDFDRKFKKNVYNNNFSMTLVIAYVKSYLFKPMSDILGEKKALYLQKRFEDFLDSYLKHIVADVFVQHLSREEIVPILAQFYFPCIVYDYVLTDLPLNEDSLPIFAEAFNPKIKSMKTVLSWFDENADWQAYLSTLNREEKDKINRWRNGDNLPFSQSIKNIANNKNLHYVAFWLWIARALDELRRMTGTDGFFESMYAVLTCKTEQNRNTKLKYLQNNFFTQIELIRKDKNSKLIDFWEILNELDIALHINAIKDENTKLLSRKQLDKAFSIAKLHQLSEHYIAELYWLEARWHLYSGNLKKSVEYYEKTFDKALFGMGSHLASLIQECLVAASYLEESQKCAQRIFLARLKNAATCFGYELSAIQTLTEKLNHKEVVADWEVEMWANSFHVIFPIHSYFLGTKYPPVYAYQKRCSIEDEIKQIKPNYKNPNKTIGFAGKRMPQLVLFSFLHCDSEGNDKYLKTLKKLLEEGANVNQLSSNGESALLFALEAMDLEAMPLASQDRRLFDLLIEYPHKPETINHSTTKREKFALMQAVKTGRPDVVEKILKLGADANQLDLLKVSPLFQTLRLINKLSMGKDRLHKIYQQSIQKNKIDFNETEKEYFRREHGATGGLSHSMFYSNLAHQWNVKANHPGSWQLLKEIMNIGLELEFEVLEKYTSLEDLYNIVQLLLEAGADPNQPHTISTMSNYTPLMYAVEINDPIVFDLLKEKGGDMSLKVTASNQSKLIDYTLSDIKAKWQSDKIKL